VGVDDLNATMNPGATYSAEAAWISPTWIHLVPGASWERNMFYSFSYRPLTGLYSHQPVTWILALWV